MTFFPDYTDHGIQHLTRVSHLADFLISDGSLARPDSWRIASAEDVFVLAGAVLFHDMGMFLNRASFAKLLCDSDRPLIDEGWDRPWHTLWDEYLDEARHWDERTIRRMFGSLPWSHHESIRSLGSALLGSDELTECQRRLIGEFIRRHHHRMAHEFARFGWPGDDGPHARMDTTPELADLIGLVARSHGMGLRDTFSYLAHHHSNNLLESRGVHAIYLMTIMRVADALHVHAERAPGGQASLRKLASPYSKLEWETHQAIYDVRLDTDSDPEAICVDIRPEDVGRASTLFRLRQWHEMLQAELDQSWSILGEVYGRNPRLSQLWLSLRRVKSNIYNKDLEARLTFVPSRAAFDTAQGEYLKLLVTPLYGDRPDVGVRELLQNALDAVRERRALTSASVSDFVPLDSRFPQADVVLAECSRDSGTCDFDQGGPPPDWLHWFEVADRGVGMTAQVVRDYFLKAGATYRRSSDWQKLYTDEHGHSRVLRTGRFGVGALAAFLMGDEIQVITRHHSSTKAIQFRARLEDDLIDLFHAKREIGTTVRIKLAESIEKHDIQFKWDWYQLSDPTVVRIRNGEIVDQPGDECENKIPSEGASLPPKWRRITFPPFADVQWTYDKYATALTCNGIQINSGNKEVKWHVLKSNGEKKFGGLRTTEEALGLQLPSVSVFDPDGALPLTLTRDRLATPAYPFSEPLLESVMRDMLAYALVYGPEKRLTGDSHGLYRRLRYPGYTHCKYRIDAAQWASLPTGFTLSQVAMLQWACVKRCVILISCKGARSLPSVKTDEATAVVAIRTDLDPDYEDSFWPLGNRFPRFWLPSHDKNPFPDDIDWGGCRVLIRDNVKEFLEKRGAEFRQREEREDPFGDDLDEVSDRISHLPEADSKNLKSLAGGKFFMVESGRSLPDAKDSLLHACAAWFQQKRTRVENAGIVCEWFLDQERTPTENALVALWRTIIGQPTIPYTIKERREQLAHSFAELSVEVSAWEKIKDAEAGMKVKASEAREVGHYPHFLNQQEVKDYLKLNQVTRSVRVRKEGDWWTRVSEKVGFVVYVPYSREELTVVNPLTPKTGNPFKGVDHDKNLLPEFRLIERLLEASNASHPTVIGPPRE